VPRPRRKSTITGNLRPPSGKPSGAHRDSGSSDQTGASNVRPADGNRRAKPLRKTPAEDHRSKALTSGVIVEGAGAQPTIPMRNTRDIRHSGTRTPSGLWGGSPNNGTPGGRPIRRSNLPILIPRDPPDRDHPCDHRRQEAGNSELSPTTRSQLIAVVSGPPPGMSSRVTSRSHASLESSSMSPAGPPAHRARMGNLGGFIEWRGIPRQNRCNSHDPFNR